MAEDERGSRDARQGEALIRRQGARLLFPKPKSYSHAMEEMLHSSKNSALSEEMILPKPRLPCPLQAGESLEPMSGARPWFGRAL
jgi:hypothetical protein